MTREGRYKDLAGRSSTALRDDGTDDCARLVVMSGEGVGRKYDVREAALIGRDQESCTIVFDDTQVSRKHAMIAREPNGAYSITDTDSRNGTFVNETRVSHRTLAYGDRIGVGRQVLLVARYSPSQSQLIERQRFEALGRLAAGVAHDFNNMLGVVRTCFDYLADHLEAAAETDEDALESVMDGRESAARAAELASRLLAFGRSGRRGHRTVDVTALCRETAHLLRSSIPPAIEVECDAQPKLLVTGDEGELHQMLMNLVLNARDAMPEGGELKITARRVLDGGAERVVIGVRDTGTGMDDATCERIFEPFFTTKEGTGGIGLGLSTVRDIVSTHAGRISVRSDLTEGSYFEVVLPAAVALATSSPQAAPPRVVASSDDDTRELRAARVLVVDDEEMARRSSRRLLRRAGHVVVEAEDGQGAVERYRALDPRPDLVLLDLVMPSKDGEQTLAELLAIDPAVRVVIYSGHLDADKQDDLLARGACDALAKPCSSSQLLAAIEQALSGRPAPDELDVEDHPTAVTLR